MDKLSNKLRLVRSQSMGVGMSGAGGGISGAAAAARRTPAGSSSSSGQEGRPASIVLLDERRLEMVIQPRLYAGELLDLVASHCGLREKEYFGLAVADESGHFTWLQLERRVLDHELPRRPASLAVHFLVKFFLESIAHLADNRTIELFYLQARGLVFRGTLEAEADIVFQLAALALQSAQGDPPQEEAAARALIRKSAVLPAAVLKEHPSAHCEDRVLEHWQKTRGQTRGQAVVNYMSIVESMPTYGVHYFEVLDKRQTAWWLGLSCRGIAQYAHADRRTPVRVFPWRQLENLYFRDKKFSIEVHDARRVVQTLSSVNLYEDALRLDSSSNKDDALVDAIADSTTQVSVSRRTLDPGTIHVYVWFGRTQALTKCIWQSAISQHQFYLDRKQARARHQQPPRSLKEIARNLTRSSASLSSASSLSNLSHSGSTHSLAVAGATALSTAVTEEQRQKEDSEETKRARMEMVSALKARREALDAKLKEKTRQLKELCVKEGELTGELPPETPLAPGEPAPTIRRRVGTEFALSEDLLRKPTSGSSTSEGELLAALELELEIQSKITSAALKLASDAAAPKSVRKQRKVSYQQSQRKLKEIEAKLNALKYFGASSNNNSKQQQPRRKQSRPEGITRSESARGVGDELLRKGMSVPDLEAAAYREEEAATLRRIGNDGDCDEDETDGLSPRSCPASPRKHPQGGGNKRSHDSVSLDNANSPHRMPRVPAGYLPSSVYLRSSYRSKQFPTLLSNSQGQSHQLPLLKATADTHEISPATSSSSRSATLPSSPFRNRYESHLTQCDSPVGLYNCPQQRTSQAFSSLDDIDAMISSSHGGSSDSHRLQQQHQKQQLLLQQRPLPPKPRGAQHHPPPFQRLEAAAVANAYPSLERSTVRRNQHQQQAKPPAPLPQYNAAMANRELPALPSSASMEDLESLEAAGLRGRSKMSYREVVVLNGKEATSTSPLGLGQHNLQSADEYPSHSGSSGSQPPSASGLPPRSHNIVGLRPLDAGGPYPPGAALTGATLLPGQTYPEPKPHLPSVASLQDVLFHHHQRAALGGGSSSQKSGKIETTFGLNDSVLTSEASVTVEAERPPPLFPKQYHQVVEQRRRSETNLTVPSSSSSPVPVPPRSLVSESPVVNRRVKPVMATPPAPPLPPTPSTSVAVSSSQQHHLNESFENVPPNKDSPSSSPSKVGSIAVTTSNGLPTTAKFVPYRESSKPFEMSDFYKYSTKYRKSVSREALTTAANTAMEANGGSNTDSPRSSTASGSGSGETAQTTEFSMASKKDLGDDFSSEMLAWYNSTQEKTSASSTKKDQKPATLV